MTNKGQIFFIMWVSCSGKWTLRKNLEWESLTDSKFLKSYVTRPMRVWEINGDMYNFISEKEFRENIGKKEFLEYEKVHDLHYYGTKYRDAISEGIEVWKKVIKEIDMRGLKNIHKNHPELQKYITSIFLDISEEKLSERIKKRGAFMSQEELNQRKKSLRDEKRDSKVYCDYIIDTSIITPEEVLYQVLDIINK